MSTLRRAVARGHTWWVRIFIAGVVLFLVDTGLPVPVRLAILAVAVLGMLVTPPFVEAPATVLEPPLRGRWMLLNSPGTKVPSHGTTMYGQARAVDLLDATGWPERDVQGPYGGWGLRGRRPEEFAGFGLPVYAMAAGTVVRASDGQKDHRARTTWPQLAFMMIPEGLGRELAGVRWVLGNHVLVRHDDGTVAAYAHLRRSSLRVRAGDRVEAGQVLGEIGNTGNTSEPHLHVQLMDRVAPQAAAGLPMVWRGVRSDAAERVDVAWGKGPTPSAQPGLPPAGQIVDMGAP